MPDISLLYLDQPLNNVSIRYQNFNFEIASDLFGPVYLLPR